MKSTIFLDIDGVLAPYPKLQKPLGLSGYERIQRILHDSKNAEALNICNKDAAMFLAGFDMMAVSYIHQLQKTYNADIVITSSWRTFYSLEQLKAMFSLLDIEVMDALPEGFPRSDLIKNYVLNHGIKSWIAIDDMDMRKSLSQHLIKTEGVFDNECFIRANQELRMQQ